MKRFFKKTFLFLLPFLLIISTYELLNYSLGENLPMSKVHELQKNDSSALFMRGILSQEFNHYKQQGIIVNQPKILAIGSSRVMQFQSFCFQKAFYNGGGMLQIKWDLDYFLQSEIKAETIIIGLDPWWFKKDNLESSSTWLNENREDCYTFERLNGIKKHRRY